MDPMRGSLSRPPPSKQAMILYELPISLSSFKLRLALGLKGVAVERREPPGGGYRSEAYRAINPAGTIPALADGRGLLAESDAIIDYLDDLGLGRPLRPADPWLAARHRMLSRWCDFMLDPAVRRLFPLPGAAIDRSALREADAAIARSLAIVESALAAGTAHALADEPGLADCGLTAVMAWLTPLTRVLPLEAAPGARLLAVAEALAAHPATASECADYGALVERWIASRSGA